MFSRKFTFTLFSIILVFSMIVGCAPAATPTDTPAEKPPSDVQPTTVPAADQPTDAVQPAEANSEPVEILWIHPFQGYNDQELKAVEDAASAYLQKKGVNAKIKFDAYRGFEDYQKKVPLSEAAGETCDLVFTANWVNDFFGGSRNGYFLSLDDLLPKYAPELWAYYSPEVWNGSRGTPGGPITAVPNGAPWYDSSGITIADWVTDKYPLDLSTINKPEDLEGYMADVLEKEPGLRYFFGNRSDSSYGLNDSNHYGYTKIPNLSWFLAMKYDDKDHKIVNITTLPEYAAKLKMTRDWAQKRFMWTAVKEDNELMAAYKANQVAADFSYYDPTFDGVADSRFSGVVQHGKLIYSPLILDPNRITASMNAVCATSEHPEIAVQVLNLDQTDAEFYNILAWGVPDRHWTWQDKDKKLIQFTNSDFNALGYQSFFWSIGNYWLQYYTDPSQADRKTLDVIKANQDKAVAPVFTGFVFDPTSVQTEMANLASVQTEFEAPLFQGSVADVDQGLKTLQEKLKEAGIDKVLAEAQKQVDAWYAANNQ